MQTDKWTFLGGVPSATHPRCQLGRRLFTNWKWDAIRGRSYHPAQKMIKEEHIVLERSARLNLDPGRGDWGDGWSFAIGQSLWIIWSFARGRSSQMIICKRPVPLNDHFQEAGSSGGSFARGWSFRMIICKRPAPPDDEAGPSNNNNNTRRRNSFTRAGTPIEDGTRGRRGPKNVLATGAYQLMSNSIPFPKTPRDSQGGSRQSKTLEQNHSPTDISKRLQSSEKWKCENTANMSEDSRCQRTWWI